ncbi:MAG: N-acetyltransferase [Microbacteriaceae bacterium]
MKHSFSKNELVIRPEQERDRPQILKVTRDAFLNLYEGAPAEPIEPVLLDWIWASEEYLPQFSLLAEINGTIVAHAIATRGWVGQIPALGLGPISVLPEFQRMGIGAALLAAIEEQARSEQEPLIALLGSTDYYPKFGYESAATHGIIPRSGLGRSLHGPHFGCGTAPRGNIPLCRTVRQNRHHLD